MMQLDLNQPAGQELGGRKRRRVQDPHRKLPGVIGQLLDDRAKGHRRAGQVEHEILRPQGRAVLDVGFPCLCADIGGAFLPELRPDQQVTHRVGAAGQVRQDVRPRPARQQRRLPEFPVVDDARRVEQALRCAVDLVAHMTLCGVHSITLEETVTTASPKLGLAGCEVSGQDRRRCRRSSPGRRVLLDGAAAGGRAIAGRATCAQPRALPGRHRLSWQPIEPLLGVCVFGLSIADRHFRTPRVKCPNPTAMGGHPASGLCSAFALPPAAYAQISASAARTRRPGRGGRRGY
jgi:hypothetical protein